MSNIQVKQFTTGLFFALTLATAAFAQDTTEQQPRQTSKAASGQKQKVSGVILLQNTEALVVRNERGAYVNVVLTGNTRVQQQRKKMLGDPASHLPRGLFVEVEGRINNSGYLVAEKVRFSKSALIIASVIGARVDPVEQRISANEENAEKQAAQIEESNAVAKTALRDARTAQQAAGVALLGVMGVASGIDEVISGLDQYEPAKTIVVNFMADSASLSPEAKAALNEIAQEARDKDGYVIEVEGFASSEGSADHNYRLSKRRADAVVAYLIETRLIPPRRIVAPVGSGAVVPIADDASREGRQQNRRVEVKMLINRTLGSLEPNDKQ